MPKTQYSIPVNPDVLKWLRTSSGWTIDDVSKQLKVPPETIIAWENGKSSPTFYEINKLAIAYKRPSAAFFLPKPAKELPLPHDFRRLPSSKSRLSKETIQIIRKAQNMQLISNELMQNLNMGVDPDVKEASIEDDPDRIALIVREEFGLTIEEQLRWENERYAFRKLKEIIESQNIRVFQFRMPIEELRGFTLLAIKPYVIVVNSADNPRARIFTLMHEYGHILLNIPSLCTPESPTTDRHGFGVEKWCNQFAASFLLPSDVVIKEFGTYSLAKYGRIANRYKVSNFATLIRLYSLELINDAQFKDAVNVLKSREAEQAAKAEEKKAKKAEKEKQSPGGGEPAFDRAKREMGNVYVSLVLQNSQKGFITYSKALDYLNIKTHHLRKLMNNM